MSEAQNISAKPKGKFVNPLKGVFTGRFLTSRQWAKNWPFILFLSFLAMVMIASSHSAERKVHEIARLRSQMKELNSEYIDTKSRLMLESMESKVVEKAKDLGLERSKTPPAVIKTGNDKE